MYIVLAAYLPVNHLFVFNCTIWRGPDLEIFRFDHVSLEIKTQRILKDVSFSAEQGDLIGISGPSGSGKTSLLRLMNLLRSPTEGVILYNTKNLLHYEPTQLRREVAYVLQKPYLFDGTTQDNFDYSYQVWRQKPDEREIADYMERANLPMSLLKKSKNEMSGGEQQRVALIRSLLAKPKVLLLDEVTASLDEENTLLLEQLIREEWANRALTVFFISHHSEQLRRLAKTVLYIEQGQIGFCGSTDNFFRQKGGLNDE